MTDTTSALPSLTSRVLDANGRWNKIWAPWIMRLLSTVRTTAADIQTVTETFDQINATYTVQINVNNRVVGLIKLDGSGALSEFSVLADKFKIVNPSDNGDEVVAFEEGLIDGVPTVGLNGNVFIDGTILARSMNVDELTAISAHFGDAAVDGILTSSNGKMVLDFTNGTLEVNT